ncbi:metal-dependent hydrolase family protein [Oceanibacterium hippocampi]|uniref:Imidazolonepropionase n=1 Tax=Oceanibacterium hippocampi TaxID=745714 RepID=A0A1Y5TLC7_9PROT|nr:amidohydrolase family protein [Oceanibacterium hippocampi]SLN64706.1 imidazolonepropionase [Oceanibacterium hippocampi]
MTTTAIIGGLLVDGTGADPVPDSVVVIEDGRITFAGKKNGKAMPRADRVIEANGASVMPGLMDVHVHISLSAPSDLLKEMTARPVGEAAFEVANNLADTVAGGVTTIRTVSDLAHLDIAARNAIAQGKIVGPRIHPCGKGLTTTGGHGDIMPCWLCQSHGDISEMVDGPDAIRKAIRVQAKTGATWIKLFQTGGVVDPHGRIEAEEFMPDEFDTAVSTATTMGLPVAVHAHNKTAILRSIRAGCRSIEHGMHFDEECAEAAREHGTFLVPTLTVMDRIMVHGAQAGIADFMIANVRERTTKHHEYVKYAYDIGANIACGTDAGSLLTPHGSAGREVVQFVKCGLDPVQAIEVSTRNTAKLLKATDVGTVEEGMLGDVIVVEGDVVSNVRVLEVPGNMRHVLIAGQEVAAGGRAFRH